MNALSAGKRAALTRKRREAAKKAVQTRKRRNASAKARAAEAASKHALRRLCERRCWTVHFFEGPTGAPRDGIIDAIAFRLKRGDPDKLEVRLIQLKGGEAGVSGAEMARLDKAAGSVELVPLIAAFDGNDLHLRPREAL